MMDWEWAVTKVREQRSMYYVWPEKLAQSKAVQSGACLL